jgi:ACT domain-containing protein
MMMIVDVAGASKSYNEAVEELEKLGEEIGVSIKCQREEIFDMMHRI